MTPVTPKHDKEQKKDNVCPHCGLKGHLRRTHRSCLKHCTTSELPIIAFEKKKNQATLGSLLEEVPVVTDVKNTERKSSMAQPEARSEDTGYVVLSSAYGNSQADSTTDGELLFSQSSKMESEENPSQSTQSDFFSSDDVMIENPKDHDSDNEEDIDWVQKIDVIDFDDDIGEHLDESDDDL